MYSTQLKRGDLMANSTAVADPNEEPQGVITVEEIVAFYEEVKALHPSWFRDGEGWDPVINQEPLSEN
jgi:hypothetical protein